MTGNDAVRVEDIGAVRVLRLSQPETRNALAAEIKAGLEIEIPRFFDDAGARCLVITGVGAAFCAGGDIRGFVEPMTPTQSRKRMARSYGWIERLLEGEKPVITAVNGPAVGAGFGLALLGDIILAADTAWFMSAFSTIGLASDYGLGRTLPRAVGAPRAKDILMSGRKVEAGEALAMGMVSRLAPPERLMDDALALAAQLAAGPTVALGLTKRLIGLGFEGSVTAYLQQEGLAQSIAFATADHREGVNAYLEKRKPEFGGG